MMFERIADFCLGSMSPPDSALDMAALLLVDTLGVAAGASNTQAGRIARDHAFRFHAAASPEDAATLLFDGRKASLSGAAFALATQIDNLDAHDGYNPTKGHIGCAVVPALCAFAEHQPDLSAHDALVALAVSYEVAARAGIALHASACDYHTSGAWNALGVAALGCRLRGSNIEALRQAFGIAEYHGPRSQMMREIANPTMLHDGSGMGALVGIMAVLLAEDGFIGAPAVTVEATETARFWQDLGHKWTIELNYIKPYPICRWAHAALDALGGLLDAHGLKDEDVCKIEVHTFAQAAALFPNMPETTSQAQYSLPFALAVRLVHGRIGPEHIRDAGLRDPSVAAALGKVTILEDARHSKRFPDGRWSDVTLHLADGTVLKSGDVHARGGPESPMEMSEVEAKFHTMAHGLPLARRAALWDMTRRLRQPDAKFSELLDILHKGVEGTAH
ncbi:MmgE/PrpD family protein [Lentibacter sp. XHP0401]|nr:MmgE/PrpD family protein [Lentibacter sp. XHP0401]